MNKTERNFVKFSFGIGLTFFTILIPIGFSGASPQIALLFVNSLVTILGFALTFSILQEKAEKE